MAHRIAPVTPTIDPADAQMVERRAISIPPAVFVGDGSTDSFYVGDRGALRVTLLTTALSGTAPTLDTTVATSPDGVAWYAAGVFWQVTAPGAQRRTFTVDRWVRFDHVLGGSGSPSVTAGVEGEAV